MIQEIDMKSYSQEQRELARAETFRLLKRLADEGEVRAYLAKYAEYLRWDGIISEQREKLVKVLDLAVEQLKPGKVEGGSEGATFN